MNRIGTRTFVQALSSSVNLSQGFWSCLNFRLCWYSTKRRRNPSVDRWNAESTLLFGSIQKKKSARKGSVKAGKKVNEKIDRTVSKSGSKKEVEHSPLNLSQVSNSLAASDTEWWHEDEGSFTEPITLHESESIGSRTDQMPDKRSYKTKNDRLDIPKIMPIPSGKQASGSGSTGKSTDRLTEKWSAKPHNSYVDKTSVDIPKIMPIPASKQPSESGSHSRSTLKSDNTPTQGSAGDLGSVSTTSTSKQIDFILQCPLFPSESQSEDMTCQMAEFHSVVDMCGMRFLPTVNTVLNKTRSDLSSFFLHRWREKMIQELGEDGFKKHQEATIWKGTVFHACVQQFLSGVPLSDIQVQENVLDLWRSLASVLPHVTEIQALETNVTHPWLCYKGTFDCIAKYQNVLYVIDWKTSSKAKPLLSSLFDNPLQVAAYLGAINFSGEFTSKFGVIEQAAIVVAYTNGEAAHIHKIQPALCQTYWTQWCQRLHQYWTTVAAEKAT